MRMKRTLFVCVENAGRSQMVEVFAASGKENYCFERRVQNLVAELTVRGKEEEWGFTSG